VRAFQFRLTGQTTSGLQREAVIESERWKFQIARTPPPHHLDATTLLCSHVVLSLMTK